LKIDAIRARAKEFFRTAPPSHDWSHVERTYKLCVKIGKKEKADLQVLKAAALLHDIARMEEDVSSGKICHAERSATMAEKILKEVKFPRTKIRQVMHCIESHRFRGIRKPKTLEAKILSDADKLDAIGAIGVARAYAYGGEHGYRLYGKIPKNYRLQRFKNPRIHNPVIEYHQKLQKIKDRLLTKTGKEIATGRHRFLTMFFKRLFKEIEGKA
jgi:uncharacterized protein